MGKEKKHHIPMRDKPFSIPEMFKDGDGFWGELTSFGFVTANFKDGEIVSVDVGGRLFYPATGEDEHGQWMD